MIMEIYRTYNILRDLFARPPVEALSLPNNIILASSSPYRHQLLQRLHLPFESYSPDIDESRIRDERAQHYVCRLALAKARAAALVYPQATVIGCDQCAVLDGEIVGKPGTHENALRQLKRAQGKTVVFHTGLCVLNTQTQFNSVEDIRYEVDFRTLTEVQLEHYLHVEQPYHCAGSFKSEGFGIVLFTNMRGEDPNTLIGLPLIRLVSMLEAAGIVVI